MQFTKGKNFLLPGKESIRIKKIMKNKRFGFFHFLFFFFFDEESPNNFNDVLFFLQPLILLLSSWLFWSTSFLFTFVFTILLGFCKFPVLLSGITLKPYLSICYAVEGFIVKKRNPYEDFTDLLLKEEAIENYWIENKTKSSVSLWEECPLTYTKLYKQLFLQVII